MDIHICCNRAEYSSLSHTNEKDILNRNIYNFSHCNEQVVMHYGASNMLYLFQLISVGPCIVLKMNAT